MAGTDGNAPCWGKALGCPTKSLGKNQTNCEAWYRCDGLSNYIISWRCHGNAADSSASVKPSTLPKCGNSSQTVDTESCPPPILCPANKLDENPMQVTNEAVIDIDIVLAIVLALFACLVLILVFVVAYKCWIARKRYHQKRLYHDRHYRGISSSTPAGHSAWWEWSGYTKQLSQYTTNDTNHGVGGGLPYLDFYISPPSHHGHPSILYKQIDESRRNSSSTRRSRQRSKVKRVGKLFGDRSVLTGSFVYHQRPPTVNTRRIRTPKGVAHGVATNTVAALDYHNNISPKSRTSNGRFSPRENSSPSSRSSHKQRVNRLTHHARGMLTPQFLQDHGNEFHFTTARNNQDYNNRQARPVRYYVQPPTPNDDFYISGKDAPRFPFPQVSSIHIPSYDEKDSNTNTASNSDNSSNHNYNNYHHNQEYRLLFPNVVIPNRNKNGKNGLLQFQQPGVPQHHRKHPPESTKNIHPGNRSSGSSYCCSLLSVPTTVSPHTNGNSDYYNTYNNNCNGEAMSEAASVASKNWQYTVFSNNINNSNNNSNSNSNNNDYNSNPNSSSGNHNSVKDIVPNNNDVIETEIVSTLTKSHTKDLSHTSNNNSPDVISSHNLSRHVTHITRGDAVTSHVREHGDAPNKPMKDFVARITVPGYNYNQDNNNATPKSNSSSRTTRSSDTLNGDNIIMKKYREHIHRNNIPGNIRNAWRYSSSTSSGGSSCSSNCSSKSSKALVSQELSYDYFRNEHLRQLSRKGAVASASTLDKAAGHRIFHAKNFHLLHQQQQQRRY